jgi:predicted membrane-bound mannosyltransferase
MYWQWMAGWHYASSEAPILILAAAGVAVAVKTRRRFPAFFAVYTLLLAGFYSALPYKTPWCSVSILYGLALLAGMGTAALASRWRIGALAAMTAAAAVLGWQAWMVAAPLATDPRNPWAYAQSGTGVFTIRDRVEEAASAAPEGRAVALDVFTGENFWPLPWYFRRYPNVRWWRQVELHGRVASIILLSPEMEPDLIRKLYQSPPPGERELYMNLFNGYVELRPQVEVRGYLAKSLWDRTRLDQ